MSKGVSDRKFFGRILAEMDRRYQQRFESQERALEETRRATEKRFDGVNEFRGAMSDASGKYITRGECLALILAACAISGAIIEAVNFLWHR